MNENRDIHDLRFDSYITKDELINIIKELRFEHVKYLHMDLITGYLLETDPDNPKEQDIKPLYYSINIE